MYYNADGSERREWRPLEQVMRPDSLATLISAPVTDLHPPEAVDSKNREKYDRGNLGDNIIRDGGKVAATMYVKDARLITAVERGDRRETSCGYNCELDMTAGVVPAGEPDAGQRYDAVQRDIVYNHVAVVPHGRAGSEIRMRLDAAGNSIIPPVEGVHPKEENMTKERIDGVDYEVGTDAHRAAVARRDEAEKARAKELADLKADRDKQQARADKAEADGKKVAADLEAAKDVKRIDALVNARTSMFTKARSILGADFKLDGLAEVEIKRAVALKDNPALKLDGKPEAYIDALYEAAIARLDSSDERDDATEALANLRRDGRDGRTQRNDGMSAYQRALEDAEKAN